MNAITETPIDMINILAHRIEKIVKDYQLETKMKGLSKAPDVYTGYLGKRFTALPSAGPEVPWIIVRYLGDEDEADGCSGNVRIIVCTFSEDDENGWRDPLNVLTRLKQQLLAHPNIGGPFRIERPFETELPEEQPFPEWIAGMTFKVTLPQVFEEWSD
ncbi:hypothetical protein J31TS6_56950 [Brevibacillus reuszeri]|uniref:hypothetical protein n=1 Tax=Brevibacillus reuszeri TaxID=54915 RepID=UPI001B2406C4|nr:hypothetical protein [Brevibacillus reuszeri]GIO09667.1 hypothetical protein J31TS6_56950 [Brevibacillus reuszeri]